MLVEIFEARGGGGRRGSRRGRWCRCRRCPSAASWRARAGSLQVHVLTAQAGVVAARRSVASSTVGSHGMDRRVAALRRRRRCRRWSPARTSATPSATSGASARQRSIVSMRNDEIEPVRRSARRAARAGRPRRRRRDSDSSKSGSAGSFLISMLTNAPAHASSAVAERRHVVRQVDPLARDDRAARRRDGRRGGPRARRRPCAGRRARCRRRPCGPRPRERRHGVLPRRRAMRHGGR